MKQPIDITISQIEGSTGPDANDMFYHSYLTRPGGAHYELFREHRHTETDVTKAKAYVRKNFDALSIEVIQIRHIFRTRQALENYKP